MTTFTGRCGIVIALSWVGQRDTRWLTPLTVSSGHWGEDSDHTNQGVAGNPTTATPFYFCH